MRPLFPAAALVIALSIGVRAEDAADRGCNDELPPQVQPRLENLATLAFSAEELAAPLPDVRDYLNPPRRARQAAERSSELVARIRRLVTEAFQLSALLDDGIAFDVTVPVADVDRFFARFGEPWQAQAEQLKELCENPQERLTASVDLLALRIESLRPAIRHLRALVGLRERADSLERSRSADRSTVFREWERERMELAREIEEHKARCADGSRVPNGRLSDADRAAIQAEQSAKATSTHERLLALSQSWRVRLAHLYRELPPSDDAPVSGQQAQLAGVVTGPGGRQTFQLETDPALLARAFDGSGRRGQPELQPEPVPVAPPPQPPPANAAEGHRQLSGMLDALELGAQGESRWLTHPQSAATTIERLAGSDLSALAATDPQGFLALQQQVEQARPHLARARVDLSGYDRALAAYRQRQNALAPEVLPPRAAALALAAYSAGNALTPELAEEMGGRSAARIVVDEAMRELGDSALAAARTELGETAARRFEERRQAALSETNSGTREQLLAQAYYELRRELAAALPERAGLERRIQENEQSYRQARAAANQHLRQRQEFAVAISEMIQAYQEGRPTATQLAAWRARVPEVDRALVDDLISPREASANGDRTEAIARARTEAISRLNAHAVFEAAVAALAQGPITAEQRQAWLSQVPEADRAALSALLDAGEQRASRDDGLREETERFLAGHGEAAQFLAGMSEVEQLRMASLLARANGEGVPVHLEGASGPIDGVSRPWVFERGAGPWTLPTAVERFLEAGSNDQSLARYEIPGLHLETAQGGVFVSADGRLRITTTHDGAHLTRNYQLCAPGPDGQPLCSPAGSIQEALTASEPPVLTAPVEDRRSGIMEQRALSPNAPRTLMLDLSPMPGVARLDQINVAAQELARELEFDEELAESFAHMMRHRAQEADLRNGALSLVATRQTDGRYAVTFYQQAQGGRIVFEMLGGATYEEAAQAPDDYPRDTGGSVFRAFAEGQERQRRPPHERLAGRWRGSAYSAPEGQPPVLFANIGYSDPRGIDAGIYRIEMAMAQTRSGWLRDTIGDSWRTNSYELGQDGRAGEQLVNDMETRWVPHTTVDSVAYRMGAAAVEDARVVGEVIGAVADELGTGIVGVMHFGVAYSGLGLLAGETFRDQVRNDGISMLLNSRTGRFFGGREALARHYADLDDNSRAVYERRAAVSENPNSTAVSEFVNALNPGDRNVRLGQQYLNRARASGLSEYAALSDAQRRDYEARARSQGAAGGGVELYLSERTPTADDAIGHGFNALASAYDVSKGFLGSMALGGAVGGVGRFSTGLQSFLQTTLRVNDVVDTLQGVPEALGAFSRMRRYDAQSIREGLNAAADLEGLFDLAGNADAGRGRPQTPGANGPLTPNAPSSPQAPTAPQAPNAPVPSPGGRAPSAPPIDAPTGSGPTGTAPLARVPPDPNAPINAAQDSTPSRPDATAPSEASQPTPGKLGEIVSSVTSQIDRMLAADRALPREDPARMSPAQRALLRTLRQEVRSGSHQIQWVPEGDRHFDGALAAQINDTNEIYVGRHIAGVDPSLAASILLHEIIHSRHQAGSSRYEPGLRTPGTESSAQESLISEFIAHTEHTRATEQWLSQNGYDPAQPDLNRIRAERGDATADMVEAFLGFRNGANGGRTGWDGLVEGYGQRLGLPDTASPRQNLDAMRAIRDRLAQMVQERSPRESQERLNRAAAEIRPQNEGDWQSVDARERAVMLEAVQRRMYEAALAQLDASIARREADVAPYRSAVETLAPRRNELASAPGAERAAQAHRRLREVNLELQGNNTTQRDRELNRESNALETELQALRRDPSNAEYLRLLEAETALRERGFDVAAPNPTIGDRVNQAINWMRRLTGDANQHVRQPSYDPPAHYASIPRSQRGTLRGQPAIQQGRARNPAHEAENMRSLHRQNTSADVLIRHGYDVTHLGEGEAGADYRIRDSQYTMRYDCYAVNPNADLDAVHQRVLTKARHPEHPEPRLVVNLQDSSHTPQDIARRMTEEPIPGLLELLIVTRDGRLYQYDAHTQRLTQVRPR